MDSISQAALGAAVSYAVLGPHMGKRSLLIGAAVGTLPDLDVVVPYVDAVASFTYHRSWSHSIFVLSILSWPLAWLIRRLTGAYGASNKRWWLAICLIFTTHIFLDGFTIYGTQIFWPLPLRPVAIGSIFIIDPLYTLPLIYACVVAWRKTYDKAYRTVFIGLSISTLYLAWTVTAQYWTERRVIQQMQKTSVDVNHLLVAPFPTTLLWRIVGINDTDYYESFVSLLDDHQHTLDFMQFDNGRTSCPNTKDSWAVQRMDWFTQGAIALSRADNKLIVTDLRMGIEDNYVFEFVVGRWENDEYQDITGVLKPLQFDTARVASLFRRITDTDVIITTESDGVEHGCSLSEQE